jgi:general secretion pathway protein A
MYVEHFRLRKEPFSIAPDPRFLFMSERHREALAHLLYGVGGGGGFVLLTGAIGAGKTTVCRCFLEQVPKHCQVAYIFNPKLSVAELLETICQEFGIALPPEAKGSVKQHVDALNTFLLKLHADGRNAVLVIDEAQSLAPEVLEQLRLLTNLETHERKLLQIILIGQPELRDMLATPGLEQLAQRVIARYHLEALDGAETLKYVRHRLAVAGGDRLPFEREAAERLHALTGGVPRRINLLADRALLGAYSQGLRKVDRKTLEQAAAEVFGQPAAGESRRRWGVGLGAAALAVGLVLWAFMQMRPASAPPAVARAASGALVASQGASAASTAGGGTRLAVTAPVPAAGTAAVDAPAAPDSAAVLAQLFAGPAGSEDSAVRALAARWPQALREGRACEAAPAAGLACYRARGGLALVRQLGRPVALELRAEGGRSVHVVLDGLGEQHASLVAAAGQPPGARVALADLAPYWRGEFVTLWRPPPGYRGSSDLAPATREWVQRQLAAAASPTSATAAANRPAPSLRDQIFSFQLAQGLEPDGLAGPVTLMRLALVGAPDPLLTALR